MELHQSPPTLSDVYILVHALIWSFENIKESSEQVGSNNNVLA